MRREVMYLGMAMAVIALTVGSAQAVLVAHYTFDVDDGGTTPDAVGVGNFATLGERVAINTTEGLAKVGSGVLHMMGPGELTGSPDAGAVSSNMFEFGTGARTFTFWWRADVDNPDYTDTAQGTYVSTGVSAGFGNRFDVRESGAGTSLRVEVNGGFAQSNPAIDDGDWYFIAVTAPEAGTVGDIALYVNGNVLSPDRGTAGRALTTQEGPLVMGASVVTNVNQDARVPYGFLDDVQVYDIALTDAQIQSLYANPGSVIPEPATLALLGLGSIGLLKFRRR